MNFIMSEIMTNGGVWFGVVGIAFGCFGIVAAFHRRKKSGDEEAYKAESRRLSDELAEARTLVKELRDRAQSAELSSASLGGQKDEVVRQLAAEKELLAAEREKVTAMERELESVRSESVATANALESASEGLSTALIEKAEIKRALDVEKENSAKLVDEYTELEKAMRVLEARLSRAADELKAANYEEVTAEVVIAAKTVEDYARLFALLREMGFSGDVIMAVEKAYVAAWNAGIDKWAKKAGVYVNLDAACSGIYRLVREDGAWYVGQAKNLRKRLRDHGAAMWKAKDGVDAELRSGVWKVEVLELVEEAELNRAEQWWIENGGKIGLRLNVRV